MRNMMLVDNDVVLDEVRKIFELNQSEMYSYIHEFFNQDEVTKHSENLMRIVSRYDGDIALLKLKLLKNDTERETN